MRKWILAITMAIGLAACSTLSTDPAQNALNTTADTCTKVGAAIKALDAAVLTNSIKKTQAQQAAAGLTAANAGCSAALVAIQSSVAASAPAK